QAYEMESMSSPSSGTTSPRHSTHSTNSNMTTLFTRQVEEMEIFQATWQSDILQMRQTQRHQYREFVIELYHEYQARLASLSDEQQMLRLEDTLAMAEKKIDGKELVAAAASRIKQWDADSKTSSLRSESTGSKRSAEPSVNEVAVKSIEEMGFEREQAETALFLSNQSLEAAIGLLLENRERVDQFLIDQKAQRPPSVGSYRRSQSLSQVPRPALHSPQPTRTHSARQEPRRHSLLATSSSSSSIAPLHHKSNSSPNLLTNMPQQSSSAHLGKSWMNSFLHQQKQAMENTNLSSVRKLGGWLGKAMENLGMDHDSLLQKQQQYNAPQLVESFTILMGTAQIKSSHNLRLLVADEAEIFHPPYDPQREMAYRAETSTKLYTSHLSAAIVLVDLAELTRPQGWRQYKTGKGSNRALFERCQQSTEFHFADMETQLTCIQQDFEHHPDSLVEGTFFVTKHANLPSSQIIFHLVIDSTANAELTNRHALIRGLRHILKMTCQFDITSLSIPLLLLPEQSDYYPTSDPTIAWLQKRGEVVMKCIKGFLIENSRSGKRVQSEGSDRAESSMGGGGMRNIEFILPHRPEVYKTLVQTTNTVVNTHHMDIPPEVELAFQQFRTLLVNLFRTS
ncbi:Protein C12orf4, partial [Choanephora cucurbitarum]